jgi:UDP-3-O-[3-hydroxymyristoyl] glucosamine N-acyltransferase
VRPEVQPETRIGRGVIIGGNVQFNGNVTINGDVYIDAHRQ